VLNATPSLNEDEMFMKLCVVYFLFLVGRGFAESLADGANLVVNVVKGSNPPIFGSQ
jgi:hypothetical protein